MKSRKSRYLLGLAALALFLSVGYAVVNSVTLTVGGTAGTTSYNMDVSFNGTVTTNKATGTDSDVTVSGSATEGSLSATIAVTNLKKTGDKVTATYTIQNEEPDLTAAILKKSISVVSSASTSTDLSSFYKVTTDVDSIATKIAAGSTNTVTITVELIKVPIETNDATANITVEFTASPEQPA